MTDYARRSIGAIVGDLERMQAEIGAERFAAMREPDDREAHDIIARILRRMAAAAPRTAS